MNDGYNPQEFVGQLRAFLRPTLRGKLRRILRAIRERMFPAKLVPLYRPGDVLNIDNQEYTVERCQGRQIILTDGSMLTI